MRGGKAHPPSKVIEHVLMLLFVLSHCDSLLVSTVTVAIPRNLQSRENLAERPRKASLVWITCQKVAVGTGGERGGEPAAFHAPDAVHLASGFLSRHVQQTHPQGELAKVRP
jgi:hypothetical protein